MAQYEFPALPFSMDALKPHISAETLDFHYNKHHKGYFEKMLKLLPGSGFEGEPLETIIKKSQGPLFNNSAQHWNHMFYWNSLTPKGKGEPQGKVLAAINEKFGSFNDFRLKFGTAAAEFFGSGWAWLVADSSGKLEIVQTSNAENPLRQGKIPLLTVDLWEHAYYIDYRNARAKYLESLWGVLNWEFAQSNFERLSKSQAA
jgi:superoxide dismutase, Fe-Mn family